MWHVGLKQAVDDRGWTAAELARRSEVSIERVYKYLSGAVVAPRGDTLHRLSAALNVSERWLLFGDVADLPGLALTTRFKQVPIFSMSDLAARPLGSIAQTEMTAVPDSLGPKAFAVRQADASMSPRIERGDLVICDPDREISPGDIVLARVAHSPTAVLRRYRPRTIDRKIVSLIAENPDFPDIDVSSETDGQVVARVVKRYHDL